MTRWRDPSLPLRFAQDKAQGCGLLRMTWIQWQFGSRARCRCWNLRSNQHLDHLYRLGPTGSVIRIERDHPFLGGARTHAGSVGYIDREGSRIRVYSGVPNGGIEVIQDRNRAGNPLESIVIACHSDRAGDTREALRGSESGVRLEQYGGYFPDAAVGIAFKTAEIYRDLPVGCG